MKITVFTSNQPRHTRFIELLTGVADEVFAVQECATIFPGRGTGSYRRTEVMDRYFKNVLAAERTVFGSPGFESSTALRFLVQKGDLSLVEPSDLGPAVGADIFIVFGASFIKPPLVDFLVDRRAINIHMGTSPYYRGDSCNFWALYDERPDYVGATIHLLSKGLDSGPMLFHAFPASEEVDAFTLGMKSVAAAQNALVQEISHGTLFDHVPAIQDRSLEYRYARRADFTDEVAEQYMNRVLDPESIKEALDQRDTAQFLRPIIASA